MNTTGKNEQRVVGSTLKRKRLDLRLSVAEAASLLCVPVSTYRLWEQTSAGMEALPFVAGDWDKTLNHLSGVKSKPFLECIGKLHAYMNEENQAQISSKLDDLTKRILSKFFDKL